MAKDGQFRGDDYSGEKNSHSHLFTLRVWQEATGPADAEWRGRLQHILSGQVCYFRDWGALLGTILSMLSESERASSVSALDGGGDGKRQTGHTED